MPFQAGQVSQAVEKDTSGTDTPRGLQERVVIVGSSGLGYYLEGKVEEVPSQFLQDSGSGVPCT